MTGPTAEWSTGGLLVGGALLADAIALATGGLLTGATLDGNGLVSALADATTELGDAGPLEIDARAAGWCRPEHADNSRHAATASAGQRRIDIPHCLA